MSKPFDNLSSKRYKTCGYGKPQYDQDGHYDEVWCNYSKEPLFCGEKECPLDTLSKEETMPSDMTEEGDK